MPAAGVLRGAWCQQRTSSVGLDEKEAPAAASTGEARMLVG
jgi:hypothetical protein